MRTHNAAGYALLTLAFAQMLQPSIGHAGDGYAVEPAARPPIWRGFYFGADLGSGAAQTSFEGLRSRAKSGLTLGGHAGYQAQVGSLVIGVEGNYAGFGIEDELSNTNGSVREKLEGIASIRGRLGFAFNRFMIYGTAGAARAAGTLEATDATVSPAANYKFNLSANGYVAGGGIEANLSEGFSGRLEALYYRFDNIKIQGYSTAVGLDTAVIRAGLSYHIK